MSKSAFSDVLARLEALNLFYTPQFTKLSWDGIAGKVTITYLCGEDIDGKILSPILPDKILAEIKKVEAEK